MIYFCAFCGKKIVLRYFRYLQLPDKTGFTLRYKRLVRVSLWIDPPGGEGGIRTHDPVFDRILLFESRAFSRSATSPQFRPAPSPSTVNWPFRQIV